MPAPFDPDHDPDRDPLGPPPERFWTRYNGNLEFPTSVAVALLALSLMFGGTVAVLVVAMLPGKDAKAVPIVLAEGGTDEAGDGSPGSGGDPTPLAVGTASPTKEDIKLQELPKDLPQVRDDLNKQFQIEDPSAVNPFASDEKAAAYGALSDELQKKLLTPGQRKGDGPGGGSGGTGQPGAGPGGTGADATRARSLRWVLRFDTHSGRDYLDKLMAMRAVVTVPLPPDNTKMYIFRNLAHPRPGTVASDADLANLSRQIQFCDIKRKSVESVGEALGLNFTPSQFWAFFPADLEKELARKEVAYRNRRPESIEETVFQVTVRGGEYSLEVAEQKAKH